LLRVQPQGGGIVLVRIRPRLGAGWAKYAQPLAQAGAREDQDEHERPAGGGIDLADLQSPYRVQEGRLAGARRAPQTPRIVLLSKAA
jgi:hypothetical protein